MGSKLKHFAHFHLVFRPFENQRSVAGQDTKALSKALAQVVAPALAQHAILGTQPGAWPGVLEVWWIENDHVKAAIGKGEGAKIHQGIWFDMQLSSVAQNMAFTALVSKNSIWVLAVKPHHSAAAAGVEYAGSVHEASKKKPTDVVGGLCGYLSVYSLGYPGSNWDCPTVS